MTAGGLAMLALASGCATNQYMGISLKPGAADPAVQALATRASVGDKQAQLDLGIRLEEGVGVVANVDRAARLYSLAASESGGTLWVYLPPVGNGSVGRVIPVERGSLRAGLVRAQNRLAAIKQRRNCRGRVR